MKRLLFIFARPLAIALIGWGLASCDKDAPTSINQKQQKEETVNPQSKEDKSTQGHGADAGQKAKPTTQKEEPKSRVERAYESLGLKKLEIDSLNLPTMPKKATNRPTVGRDSLWRKRKAWLEDYHKRHGEYPMISPSNVSAYMIWAYAIPDWITIGDSGQHLSMVNDDEPNYKEVYKKETFLPLTLGFKRQGWCSELSESNRLKQTFDSLCRLHHIKLGKESMQPHTPTPYNLRRMVIAHNGLDISPLFSIRYSDYREVATTDDYTRVNVVDKRVSEVTTNELDWLYGGFFWLKPLTNQYPNSL
ncbi:MAG: hypothetical protein Q4A64_05720 [Porphyromonadaceae bacterium]|nr:hypothetical protein [Porphyromonadaceae bacterium]